MHTPLPDHVLAFAGWTDSLDNLLDAHLLEALSAERLTMTELREMFAAGATPEEAGRVIAANVRDLIL